MPPRRDSYYLEICHRLARIWQHAPDIFVCISTAERWQLHDYFRPSHHLCDEEDSNTGWWSLGRVRCTPSRAAER